MNKTLAIAVIIILGFAILTSAQDEEGSAADLAKKLANPIAGTTTLWLKPVVSSVTSMGKQKVQFATGPRINLVAPDGSRVKFGVRAVMILLLPK